MTSVPAARFDFREFPPADRLAAFRQLTSAVYETWAAGAPEDFQAEALGYQVGPLIFNEAQISPARFRRSRAHLCGDGRDVLVLQAQLAGSESLVINGRVLHLLPGNIYLRDWAQPFESNASAIHLHSVLIPRHRLASTAVLTAKNPVLSWSIDEPEGGLLFLLWSELIARLPGASLRQAERMSKAFLGFLDGMLRDELNPRDSASLQAMEHFLQLRLRQEISADDLVRHFHVSRSTVYRLFARHGGVNGYLVRLRMERVYADLMHADPKRASVSELASAWGFYEASSFSRRFRKQFGRAPSEVLNSPYHDLNVPISMDIRGPEAFRVYTEWLQRANARSRFSS
jgi:AraC-like DNA-binding protein